MLSPSRIVDVKSTAIECAGFSVHAQVRVAQGDRRGGERLCLYAARPPFAEDQLRMTDDGRVRLTLRRPPKNGQGAIVLSPVQFLESSHVAQTLGRMRRQRCARDPPEVARWHVLGVDLSRALIEAADTLRHRGERSYFRKDEGPLGRRLDASIDPATIATVCVSNKPTHALCLPIFAASTPSCSRTSSPNPMRSFDHSADTRDS